MMNNNNFSRPQQLLRNHETPHGFDDPSTSISNDVRVAFFESESGDGVDSRIHTDDEG